MSNKQQFSNRERKRNNTNKINIYSSKHIRLIENNMLKTNNNANNKNNNTNTDNNIKKNIKNSKEKIDIN